MSRHTIKILLVDESEERSAALCQALREGGYEDVTCLIRPPDVLDEVLKRNPDVILIDVESPTRDTLEQLTLIRDKQPRPVVLFSQDRNVQSIRAAIDSGVCSYVTADIRAADVRPAIEVAMATFRQFQSLRSELQQARADLSNQKAVDRAKTILMSQHNLNEEQAYHFLRRVAMNRKKRILDVAQDVIAFADLKPV